MILLGHNVVMAQLSVSGCVCKLLYLLKMKNGHRSLLVHKDEGHFQEMLISWKRVIGALQLPFAYLQTQNRQAVALPDTLEARFYLWLKSHQVALRMFFLKPAICLDHSK